MGPTEIKSRVPLVEAERVREYLRAVRSMRRVQKRFFKGDKSAMREAMFLEGKVDAIGSSLIDLLFQEDASAVRENEGRWL